MHKHRSELEAERASVLLLQRFQKNYITLCNGFEMDPGVWPVHVSLGLSVFWTILQRFQKNYITLCNGFEMDPGVWPVHVQGPGKLPRLHCRPIYYIIET